MRRVLAFVWGSLRFGEFERGMLVGAAITSLIAAVERVGAEYPLWRRLFVVWLITATVWSAIKAGWAVVRWAFREYR